MADLQIFQLPAKATPTLADKIPIQDASGADGAKYITLDQVKTFTQESKRFVGTLFLNGTSVPTTSTVLNTLGGTFTFTKNATGDFTAACSVAAFPTSFKVIVMPKTQIVRVVEFGLVQIKIVVTSSTTLRITAQDVATAALVDANISSGELNFDISVYP